ncbi:prolyl aminopeptidase [Mycoplasma procyoni]|uniref:prolyl aminopeptidase n=1 Tax=Mycoplasma procyoni TaxID=568784 RepID=UPI00197B6A80|nr:prolyl aminopeptidase [Mycoplasma procyoni]MBN3534397.1 prolyl aminopeptidase [Mycoplasma procyoni]
MTNLVEKNYLQVDSLHKIYYEVYGKNAKNTVFVVHGGPGGGMSQKAIKLFDLNKFRVVLFDQRGCGKSLPQNELKNNNTQELIEDIEKLRKHLNIDKIGLFGGSWGTTLSLLYAIKYPQNTNFLLLRAVFLARQEDVDFLYEKEGAETFYPDYFDHYFSFIKNQKEYNPDLSIIENYYNILKDPKRPQRHKAAEIFSSWESCLVSIKTYKHPEVTSKVQQEMLDIALLESHYFVNRSFLESDNFILDNAHKIENIKTFIIHGRQDVVCKPKAAYDLHKKLKNSQLFLVDEASHSTIDKALYKQLKKVIDSL